MSYSIRYLPLSVEDINALAEYLSRFYPGTAEKVLTEIESQIACLKDKPHMFEEYSPDPYYRRIIVSGYLVFYHINEENKTADIHRILRGSWDIGKYLPDTE